MTNIVEAGVGALCKGAAPEAGGAPPELGRGSHGRTLPQQGQQGSRDPSAWQASPPSEGFASVSAPSVGAAQLTDIIEARAGVFCTGAPAAGGPHLSDPPGSGGISIAPRVGPSHFR